jgi:hypothetical protein
MKLPGWIKHITTVEILVGVIFVLYIVLPVSTPASLIPIVQSPFSLLVIFLVILYLFLYANPILAVLYVGVAYLLLRRSSSLPSLAASSPRTSRLRSSSNKPPTVPTIPIPQDSRAPRAAAPATISRTLEEDVVASMAPVGQSSMLVQTTFRPVASNVEGASPA